MASSMAVRWGGVSALLLSLSAPAAAQDLGAELSRFLHDDAVATIHFRSYFLDRANPGLRNRPIPNSAAWAAGGWLGYETGWLYDVLKLGAVGYTSQPVWAPADRGGTRLLKPGQYGYWALGQAYASVKVADQVFTGFRQSIDELEVNPRDDRMTPNTFEAYALRGTLSGVRYFAGYVAAIEGRDESEFHNMAQFVAPQTSANNGMLLGSLRYAPVKGLLLRGGAYRVQDVLASGYGDVDWTTTIDDRLSLHLSANVMVQGSNGANLLTRRPFSTWAAGGRGELIWGPATFSAIYTQTGNTGHYLSPYGTWQGYTRQIIRSFDRANEHAYQLAAAYDFAAIDLPGLTLRASATTGDGALNPASGAALSRNTEVDFDLGFRVASPSAPDWLKPLQFRARTGYGEQALNGVTTSITDYRLILNYEVSVGGGRR